LLSDALNATIFMNLMLKEEINHLVLSNVLIDDNDFGLAIKLGTFAKKNH
jgi:hypothetical protein